MNINESRRYQYEYVSDLFIFNRRYICQRMGHHIVQIIYCRYISTLSQTLLYEKESVGEQEVDQMKFHTLRKRYN